MVKTPLLLKTKDVAHVLDCSPDDIILLAQRGKLKGFKQGRFWRFRMDDVQAYIIKTTKDA